MPPGGLRDRPSWLNIQKSKPSINTLPTKTPWGPPSDETENDLFITDSQPTSPTSSDSNTTSLTDPGTTPEPPTAGLDYIKTSKSSSPISDTSSLSSLPSTPEPPTSDLRFLEFFHGIRDLDCMHTTWCDCPMHASCARGERYTHMSEWALSSMEMEGVESAERSTVGMGVERAGVDDWEAVGNGDGVKETGTAVGNRALRSSVGDWLVGLEDTDGKTGGADEDMRAEEAELSDSDEKVREWTIWAKAMVPSLTSFIDGHNFTNHVLEIIAHRLINASEANGHPLPTYDIEAFSAAMLKLANTLGQRGQDRDMDAFARVLEKVAEKRCDVYLIIEKMICMDQLSTTIKEGGSGDEKGS